MSVSAWVRATEPQGDFNYILAKGASGCLAASYGLYTGPNGGMMFYVARNQGLSYTRSPDAGHGVWNGDWHFVVGTYDGGSVRLYVDGSQVGNGTAHTGPIDYDFPDNDLFIGHYNNCPALGLSRRGRLGADLQPCADAPEIRDTYDQLDRGRRRRLARRHESGWHAASSARRRHASHRPAAPARRRQAPARAASRV